MQFHSLPTTDFIGNMPKVRYSEVSLTIYLTEVMKDLQNELVETRSLRVPVLGCGGLGLGVRIWGPVQFKSGYRL